MSVRRALAIIVLAIIAVILPGSASASASVTATPETRIGNFDLREPALIGFAVTRTVENHRAKSILCADLASQHSLRWKGMWRFDLGGGVEVYDARARMWSPKLGTFLSVDEFAFHNSTTTLWGWPGQSPSRWSDPDGRCGAACVGAVVGGVAGGLYYASTASTNLSASEFALGAAEAIGVGAGLGALATTPAGATLALGALGVASDKDLWKFGVGAALDAGASCPAARGGAGPVRVGQAGEAAVRAASDIGPKVSIQVAGRTRIPDGLTGTVLSEVKNVKSLSYTQQLRDFAQYAGENGLRFDLWVREDTILTGPLEQAVENGTINLRTIP